MDSNVIQVILAMVGLGTTVVVAVRVVIIKLVDAFKDSQKLIADTLIDSQRVQNELSKENRDALQAISLNIATQTEILRTISMKTSKQTEVIESKP